MCVLLGVQVRWSSGTVMVTEGDSISISLLLDREAGINFTVSINAIDLNATGNLLRFWFLALIYPGQFAIESDYTFSPSLVMFASNDSRKDVNISAIVDMLLEYNETALLHFEIASDAKEIGVVEGYPSIITVTILNNDS